MVRQQAIHRLYKIANTKVIEVENLDGIHKISDANALFEAAAKSKRGSDWKESVQRYDYNLWANIYNTQKKLNDHEYRQKDFVEFTLSERGKTRHIKSIHISDRVVQRSLCDNVLTPSTQNAIIYDNGASQINKGVDFTRKRLVEHLHRYFREYGTNDGYIILIDFKNYFGSIDHAKLIDAYKGAIHNQELTNFIQYLVDINGDIGMGIGSQMSQNAGIFFPSVIDQYFKTVKAEKYYAAYMDDRYCICRTEEHAKLVLEEFRAKAADLNLVINEKKTRIVKLSSGFTFLKVRYVLTNTGKVLQYQSNDTFKRERRRLKKYKHIDMPIERVACAYRSWRGSVIKYKNNYYRIKRMDAYFEQLFPNVEYHTKKELQKLRRRNNNENSGHQWQCDYRAA